MPTNATTRRSSRPRTLPLTPSSRRRTTARRMAGGLLCAGALLATAACGSGGSGDTGAADATAGGSASHSQAPSAQAFAECMRENGVPNFPDPDPNGQTMIQKGQAGLDPNSAAYQHAASACSSLRPAGSSTGSDDSSSSSMLAFAACMRKNGVPDFPDPKNGHLVMGGGFDPNSASVQGALEKCQSLLGGSVAGGGE